MVSKGYKPEIDGLRAIAALSVVLFHFGMPGLPGGYLGVDLFFVISGFLITRIIVTGVDGGTFSFGDFYLRRVRRILPMLAVTIVISAALAAMYLSPKALRDFGQSAVAASLSLSNVLFYREVGYFDAAAQLKPLLHTWSLGVEEQFYLLWPAALVLCMRLRPRWTPFVILTGGLLSLAGSFVFVGKPQAVFYLTPFRVWEFCSGALIVWLPERLRPTQGLSAEIGCALGLALVAFAIAAPSALGGLHQVAASLGAALCIIYGGARASGFALRNGVAVGLGKISYSTYLLHWPAVIFLSYVLSAPPSAPQRALAALALIAAAGFSWRIVEVPFRRTNGPRAWIRPRPLVVGHVLVLGLVSAVGVHMWVTDGWLWRFPPAIQKQVQPQAIHQFEAYTWHRFDSLTGPWRDGAKPKILVIGDSQAADFLNILDAAGRLTDANVRAIKVTAECQALISFSENDLRAMNLADRAACEGAYGELSDARNFDAVMTVVLAFQWDDRGIRYINDATSRLRQAGVERVFIVGRKSQGRGGPDVLLEYGLGPQIDAYSASLKNPVAWKSNASIRALHGDFTFIDMMPFVCPVENDCRVLTRDGDVIFFDGSHVSPAGARFFGQALKEAGTLPF